MDRDLSLVLISPAFILKAHTHTHMQNSKHTIKEQRITIFKGLNLKCSLSTCQAKMGVK